MLPIPVTVALVIFILGVLIVAHEFGHFITAKLFGVEAPEFAIGFPPRIMTLWRSAGWIGLQSKRIVVPRTLDLPDGLKTGDYVRYKTRRTGDREVLTSLTVVPAEEAAESYASQVQALDHGTSFTLNAVPIGGYVRLSGEDDPSAPNALAAKPAWQRGVVLIAGVIMNLVVAFIAFFVLSLGIPHPLVGATTQIVSVQPDTPAARAGLQAGDTIVAVNQVDVRDNREAMLKQLENQCGRQVTITVQRPSSKGAETMDLPLTPQPLSGLTCGLGVSIEQAVGQPIAEVAPGSLGAQMGLKPGDGLARVGSFNLITPGNTFFMRLPSAQDLAQYVQANSNVPTILPVVIVRDDRPLTLKVKIPEHVDAQQATLGVTLSPYLGATGAAGEAASQMLSALSLLPRTFAGIASGIARGTDTGVGGPIRIGQAVAEGTPIGGLPFIVSLFANLSFSLAIFNLLPIPGLDGGRLAFVLLEMLRGGRKVDPRIEGWVHLLGFMVLLVFILFVSYSDVVHVLSGKSAFTP